MPTEEALLGAIFDVTNPKKVHDFLPIVRPRVERLEANHERPFRTDSVGSCQPWLVATLVSTSIVNFIAQHFGT
jgi:hypothetical protein